MHRNFSFGFTGKGRVWYSYTPQHDGAATVKGQCATIGEALVACGIASPASPAGDDLADTVKAQAATIADLRRQLAAALAGAPAQPVADSPATPPACADSGPVATVTPIRAKRTPAHTSTASLSDPVADFAAASGFVGMEGGQNG